MCRFLAYRGEPVLIETLVCTPCHSLIQQSMHAVEGKTEINGDGFGIGWYGERPDARHLPRAAPRLVGREPPLALRRRCARGCSSPMCAPPPARRRTRANCHPFSAGPLALHA